MKHSVHRSIDEPSRWFIDANCLLHYKFFDEIDWNAELGSGSVTLVICLTVITALDKHKTLGKTNRIRKRARKVLKRLEELDAVGKSVKIRGHVRLVISGEEPSIDWGLEGLAPAVEDDRILAYAIQSNTRGQVSGILTGDTGLLLKAKGRGIPCHKISEQLLLPSVADPKDEELKKLRRQIVQLQRQLPELSIKVKSAGGTSGVGEFVLRRVTPLDQHEVDERLANLRDELAIEETSLGGELAAAIKYAPGERVRSEKESQEYLSRFREYLEENWQYKDLQSRIIELVFVLENTGNARAEDIDVFLHFPNGFEVCNEESLPGPPSPPSKPHPPRSMHDLLSNLGIVDLLPMTNVLASIPESPSLFGYEGKPHIAQTESYEVSFEVSKVKHGLSYTFDPVYAIFPTERSVNGFHIDYRILTGNVPEPTTGGVDILVEYTE